jgi:hypothetical protein
MSLKPATMPDGDVAFAFRLTQALADLVERIDISYVPDGSPENKAISAAITATANTILADHINSRNQEVVDFLRDIKSAEDLEPEAYKQHIMQAVEAAAEIMAEDLKTEI